MGVRGRVLGTKREGDNEFGSGVVEPRIPVGEVWSHARTDAKGGYA